MAAVFLSGTFVVSGQPASDYPPDNSRIHRVILQPVSPIAYFRELLVMKTADREKALADKSPVQKEKLLAKIREYRAMAPEERELRLKTTEVRWHLIPLMKLTPVERTKRLATIPPGDRELIERRLKHWDSVPLELQKTFLKNEATIGYILRLEVSRPEEREAVLAKFPPHDREKIDRELVQWRALSADERQKMCDHFQEFFELDENEKAKTLSTLSEVERREMERTLRNFQDLPPQQRKQCLASFRKFAGMKPEEREQFLKNAERWQAMKPSEREAWRHIVEKSPHTVPPPLPLPPQIFPPAPRALSRVIFPPSPAYMVSTNQAK